MPCKNRETGTRNHAPHRLWNKEILRLQNMIKKVNLRLVLCGRSNNNQLIPDAVKIFVPRS